MQTLLYQVIVGTPTAVTIWLLLIALATLLFCRLTAPAIQQRVRAARRQRQLADTAREQLRAQAMELDRYAGELAVAARRSAVTAQRRRAEWVAAHRMTESVWRAYDRASVAAGAAVAATAYRRPTAEPRDPTERAARERHLRTAAGAAYRRGELSSRQYADVLLHRAGWDPNAHPADIEARLRCAASRQLLGAYQTAAAVERAAWRDAAIAAAARDSLREEAGAAALDADQVRWVFAVTRQGSRRTPLPRPVLVTERWSSVTRYPLGPTHGT